MGWHQRLPLGSLNVVSGTYLIGTGILLSRDDAMVQRALGPGQGLPWERRKGRLSLSGTAGAGNRKFRSASRRL
jgi:hypothetical protein